MVDYSEGPEIDKSKPIPVYYQLKELLKSKIKDGIFKAHQRLPSEKNLVDRYNISKTTARKALSELENEGYIYRQQGRGSFVCEENVKSAFSQLTSFTEEGEEQGFSLDSKVLEQTIITANGEVTDKLGAERDEKLLKLQRVRLADERPLGLQTSYLRTRFCSGLEQYDFSNRSLYRTLEREYGLRISYGEQIVEAKPASEFQAEALEMEPNEPVLAVEQTSYLSDEKTIIEFTYAVYRGDRYNLFIKLRK